MAELPPGENRAGDAGLPRVEPFGDSCAAAWSQYVHGHPQGSLFHALAWKRAVEYAYSHRARYLVAHRHGRVCGVLPLFMIDSRIGGRRVVSVPYAVYGGPLADDTETLAALNNGIEQITRGCNARSCEIRSRGTGLREDETHARTHCDTDAGWQPRHGHVTFRRLLPGRPDEIAGWLPRKARAAARRAAERHPLRSVCDDSQLPLLWVLYARSMRRLGSLNYPLSFFRALLDETPGRHLVQVVWSGGDPVAGLVTFIFKGVAMPYFVGQDERHDVYGVNNFLYFECMKRAVELGCSEFDFGRTRIDNAGSFDFKRFHGFEPSPLSYREYVPPGGQASGLTPTHPRFATARRVWPRLPLAVTRPLGAWLSHSIPG